MEAVFPAVAQARGPVAGHRVLLMPNVVIYREPSAFAQSLDGAPDVAVAHAFDDLVLDVEDEAARRLQRFEERLVERHEPLDELVRVYAVVVPVARVRVGRRGDDQVRLALVSLQLLAAVAADNGARGGGAPDCGSTHGQTHQRQPLQARLLNQNGARRMTPARAYSSDVQRHGRRKLHRLTSRRARGGSIRDIRAGCESACLNSRWAVI